MLDELNPFDAPARSFVDRFLFAGSTSSWSTFLFSSSTYFCGFPCLVSLIAMLVKVTSGAPGSSLVCTCSIGFSLLAAMLFDWLRLWNYKFISAPELCVGANTFAMGRFNSEVLVS